MYVVEGEDELQDDLTPYTPVHQPLSSVQAQLMKIPEKAETQHPGLIEIAWNLPAQNSIDKVGMGEEEDDECVILEAWLDKNTV
jgi:hypothetical protein